MSRDTNFYYSVLVLPPRKRRAIIAVWDFCRAVDDAVDEVLPEEEWRGGLTEDARARAEHQLVQWRAELASCYNGLRHGSGQGSAPATPQGLALQPYIREFNLPRTPFEDLIDGVEMDLQHARYPTFDALSAYCRGVASTVGLICVEIFGYRHPSTRSYAVNLGMALQLTNIIRDVATDLQRGRVYLPLEDLERFGCRVDDLREGRVTPAIRALLEHECARAQEYYRRAAADLPKVDARSMVAAQIMGAIYYEILRRIERAGYDVFSRRIRVPRPERALIAARVWAQTMLPFR
jgi:phytoene synthase